MSKSVMSTECPLARSPFNLCWSGSARMNCSPDGTRPWSGARSGGSATSRSDSAPPRHTGRWLRSRSRPSTAAPSSRVRSSVSCCPARSAPASGLRTPRSSPRCRRACQAFFILIDYDEQAIWQQNNGTLKLSDIADFGLADGRRFAFLDSSDGLVFARHDYPSLAGAADLDAVEQFLLKSIGNN